MDTHVDDGDRRALNQTRFYPDAGGWTVELVSKRMSALFDRRSKSRRPPVRLTFSRGRRGQASIGSLSRMLQHREDSGAVAEGKQLKLSSYLEAHGQKEIHETDVDNAR